MRLHGECNVNACSSVSACSADDLEVGQGSANLLASAARFAVGYRARRIKSHRLRNGNSIDDEDLDPLPRASSFVSPLSVKARFPAD